MLFYNFLLVLYLIDNKHLDMRYFLVTLLFPILLFGCSSDEIEEQDYTSFVVVNNSDIDLPNCVIGYKKNGLWIKVADLGSLNKGLSSKEVKLDVFIDDDLYVFTDYLSTRMLDVAFRLKKLNKNIFRFPSDVRGVLVYDKNNQAEYPK